MNEQQEGVVQETTEAVIDQSPAQEASEQELMTKLSALEKERESLRRELEKVRREAAERRVEKRSLEAEKRGLEERVSELEARWKSAEEAAKRAERRARFSVHVGGDEKRLEAALTLAEQHGVDDPSQLLEQFPFLRLQSPQATPPANPGQGTRRLTASAIAAMSPEEYARRRAEVLAAMARGEIAPE